MKHTPGKVFGTPVAGRCPNCGEDGSVVRFGRPDWAGVVAMLLGAMFFLLPVTTSMELWQHAPGAAALLSLGGGICVLVMAWRGLATMLHCNNCGREWR